MTHRIPLASASTQIPERKLQILRVVKRGLDFACGTTLAPYLDGSVGGSFDYGDTISDMSNVEELSTIPKVETSREGSYSTGASSPDPEPELDEHASVPENVQVQKRKGGRKPV